MLTLSSLGVAWGAVTVALVVLMIYRSVITLGEDDQIFLDDAGSHMRQEQATLVHRITQLRPWINGLAAASGLLIVIMTGLFFYQGIMRPPQ